MREEMHDWLGKVSSQVEDLIEARENPDLEPQPVNVELDEL